MSETTPDPAAFCDDADVKTTLGRLGSRPLPGIDVGEHIAAAHADVLGRLGALYVNLPTFAGNGLVVLRWAEAKLAAAAILDILAADLNDDVREVPERLRASAYETLSAPIVGYPPSGTTPDGGSQPVYASTPRSSPGGSLFVDPYDRTAIPLWPLW